MEKKRKEGRGKGEEEIEEDKKGGGKKKCKRGKGKGKKKSDRKKHLLGFNPCQDLQSLRERKKALHRSNLGPTDEQTQRANLGWQNCTGDLPLSFPLHRELKDLILPVMHLKPKIVNFKLYMEPVFHHLP